MGKNQKSTRLQRVLLSLFLSHSGLAAAHAVVTESSLKGEPISPQKAARVELFFNSGIELALSRIFLVSKGDVQTRLEASPGKKPGQVIIEIPPLASGEYALRYRIFAADGHLTEEIIHFHVSE